MLCYKRLEQGTFELPAASAKGPITWPQLVLMLEGVSVEAVRLRKRFALPEKARKIA